MVALIVALAAAADPCRSDGPADAELAAPAPAALDDVQLVVEIWAGDAPVAWVEGLAATLRAHDAVGLFVLPPSRGAELASALAGQAVGLDLRAGLADQGDPYVEAAAVSAQARDLRRTTHLRPIAVLSPVPRRANEATLGLAGFKVLLDRGTVSGAAPRLAARYTGARGGAVVLPPAPGAGACALTPWAPFRPDVADRATRALRAASGDGLAVVRVVLDGRAAASEDADVLGRWLDRLPIAPVDPKLLPALVRSTPVDDRAAPIGRLVPVSDLRLAADVLGQPAGTLPRQLPGGLSATEAWLGFVALLAERSDGETVRLGAIHGPGNDTRTALTGVTAVPRAEVVALGAALARALPPEIPAALTVAGVPMTAAEVLLVFASAVRGDDPCTTRPIAVPEPNERGLGWGEATVP